MFWFSVQLTRMCRAVNGPVTHNTATNYYHLAASNNTYMQTAKHRSYTRVSDSPNSINISNLLHFHATTTTTFLFKASYTDNAPSPFVCFGLCTLYVVMSEKAVRALVSYAFYPSIRLAMSETMYDVMRRRINQLAAYHIQWNVE